MVVCATISLRTRRNSHAHHLCHHYPCVSLCPPLYADNCITRFRDGALLQQDARAVKGVIDQPLASGMLEPTLKIVPDRGTTILSVETYRPVSSTVFDKEHDMLLEKRRKLEDRLQALETREAIFTAAAKSQSGKAPRKTKSNPQPMQTIRQGTDFAITQLEEVYTARRRCVQEMQKIDTRLATLKKQGTGGDYAVRIAVSPAQGKVTLTYATREQGWSPQYSLHVNSNGSALLQLSSKSTTAAKGYRVLYSLGSLVDQPVPPPLAPSTGGSSLAQFKLILDDEHDADGIFHSFSARLTNNSGRYLPPGESELYRNGAYLGKIRFEGLSSGSSRRFSTGK